MKLEIQKILLAFALPLLLLFILYTLRTMESVMNWDFITWGIYPRETKGIMGIFTSPLIHADWGHLFANTFPLLFLLWCLLYFYRDLGIGILFFIWIVSGILTFIIGKPGWHIGASSIIYSLAFFLFFSGILRKHVPLVALSLLVTFLYGSLVWNMFPQFASSTTSWEGTLGGRGGRNSRSHIVQTQRPPTTGTFHWRGRGRQQQSSGKRRSHYESGPRKKEWLNQSFRHHEVQRAGRAERSNNPLTELNEC